LGSYPSGTLTRDYAGREMNRSSGAALRGVKTPPLRSPDSKRQSVVRNPGYGKPDRKSLTISSATFLARAKSVGGSEMAATLAWPPPP